MNVTFGRGWQKLLTTSPTHYQQQTDKRNTITWSSGFSHSHPPSIPLVLHVNILNHSQQSARAKVRNALNSIDCHWNPLLTETFCILLNDFKCLTSSIIDYRSFSTRPKPIRWAFFLILVCCVTYERARWTFHAQMEYPLGGFIHLWHIINCHPVVYLLPQEYFRDFINDNWLDWYFLFWETFTVLRVAFQDIFAVEDTASGRRGFWKDSKNSVQNSNFVFVKVF